MKTLITISLVILGFVSLAGATNARLGTHLKAGEIVVSPEVLNHIKSHINNAYFTFDGNDETPANFEKDPVTGIALALQFYLDPKKWINSVALEFTRMDTNEDGFLEKEEFYNGANNLGLPDKIAKRYWDLAHKTNTSTAQGLPFSEFQNLADLIYQQSLSMFAFDVTANTIDEGPNVEVNMELIMPVIDYLWSRFTIELAPPLEGNLWPAYNASDENKDGTLNRQEYYYFWAMWTRSLRCSYGENLFNIVAFTDDYISDKWGKGEEQKDCTVIIVDGQGTVEDVVHLEPKEGLDTAVYTYENNGPQWTTGPNTIPPQSWGTYAPSGYVPTSSSSSGVSTGGSQPSNVLGPAPQQTQVGGPQGPQGPQA